MNVVIRGIKRKISNKHHPNFNAKLYRKWTSIKIVKVKMVWDWFCRSTTCWMWSATSSCINFFPFGSMTWKTGQWAKTTWNKITQEQKTQFTLLVVCECACHALYIVMYDPSIIHCSPLFLPMFINNAFTITRILNSYHG